MWICSISSFMRRALSVGMVALGLFCGCRAAPTTVNVANPVFFPPAPEKPRLQFLKSFSSPDDLGRAGPGGFETFVLGKAEQLERIVTPYGAAISDGKIYVCDVGSRRVVVLDLESRSFGYLTQDRRLMNPVNIYVDDGGVKYVADPTAGAVFVFDARDTLQGILGRQANISPIDVAVRGPYCYVTDYHRNQVVVLDRATGEEVSVVGEEGDGDGQFSLISDLTFGPDGDLYVTDKLKAKVFHFDPAGNLQRTLGRLGSNIDQLVRPKGVAVDSSSRIWVVDASTEVAKIYDQQGRLLLFFGLPGNEPGMMNLPAAIVLDQETVGLFERYAVAGADIEFLVIVTNQYGPNKVSVYGYGQFPVPSRPSERTPKRLVAEGPGVPGEPSVTERPPAEETEADRLQRMEKTAQVYYNSVAMYRAGRLQEARVGFLEVLQSGLIPPPMEQTLRGYIADIDSRLAGPRNSRP
jgi:sugar lactone lactonase YvrE